MGMRHTWKIGLDLVQRATVYRYESHLVTGMETLVGMTSVVRVNFSVRGGRENSRELTMDLTPEGAEELARVLVEKARETRQWIDENK